MILERLPLRVSGLVEQRYRERRSNEDDVIEVYLHGKGTPRQRHTS